LEREREREKERERVKRRTKRSDFVYKGVRKRKKRCAIAIDRENIHT